MAGIFITGSADGLGLLAAKQLIEQGHQVLTSGMHLSGDPNLINLPAGPGVLSRISYSGTKLHDVILSMAVARQYPDIYSNAVNPGWVPTKMGGAGAPDSLEEGYATQVWLAASDGPQATVSGKYFHHKKQARAHQSAANPAIQDQLIAICEKLTGISLPSHSNA